MFDAETLIDNPIAAPIENSLPSVIDNVLADDARARLATFLGRPNWAFGWKSDSKADPFSFWHKHFAGNVQPDHRGPDGEGRQYDCLDELQRCSPLLADMWRHLSTTCLAGHRLLRCYANGAPYGSEGSIHTNSISDRSFSAIYYPHAKWEPNWGGETVFFNKDKTDIIASVYPRPNRLAIFPGRSPMSRAACRGYAPCCALR